MADFRADNVCDLTLIMRFRLLCGLYNKRAVPPRLQVFAKAYCLTLSVAVLIYIYFTYHLWDSLTALNWLCGFAQYFLAAVVSLWTADEYIYAYFTRNKETDRTLDSPTIFYRLQRHMKMASITTAVLQALYLGLLVLILSKDPSSFFLLGLSSVILQLFSTASSTTKLITMALFNSRFLILKRRLHRYGFRTIGRAPPQPYCQIYAEILQGLDAAGKPLKLLLFFDLICNCGMLISNLSFYSYETHWMDRKPIERLMFMLIAAVTICRRLIVSFGHVALLESAAGHCDAMACFTVTQLIKNPTTEERRRMYEFLRALERRGARYCVFRALPLNAQLVLSALGFCSAQALVFINMARA